MIIELLFRFIIGFLDIIFGWVSFPAMPAVVTTAIGKKRYWASRNVDLPLVYEYLVPLGGEVKEEIYKGDLYIKTVVTLSKSVTLL